MKVGIEDRRKVAAACVLSALAVLMLWHWVLRPDSSASAHSGTSATIATSSVVPSRKIKLAKSESLDPRLQVSQLELTQYEVYEGNGRNIFRSYGEDRVEKIPPKPAPSPQPPTPSPVQAVPTIRLKLFGMTTMSGKARKVCFYQDGDIFIGAEGDTVAHRFKVLRIGGNIVDIKDLLENTEHTLALP